MAKKRIDIVGQKYGKLTVIKESGDVISPKGHIARMFVCRCDCGKEVVYSMANLRSGNSRSCGCSKIIDLTGQKFGKLTVIKKDEPIQKPGRKIYKWLCKCDCGNYKTVAQQSLIQGGTRSCGCLTKNKKYGAIKAHKLRGIHHGMMLRCYTKTNKSYKHYGDRGIRVCDEWRDPDKGYPNFYEWAIKNGYSEGLTIDRINVDGDYSPENCRWITNDEQQRNKQNSRFLEYNGVTKLIIEWAEEFGIRPDTLKYRLKHGWSVHDALTAPNLNEHPELRNLYIH